MPEYRICKQCGKNYLVGSDKYHLRGFCGYFCAERYEKEHPGSNATSCFISTAVCKTLNKSDDCVELNVLRNFRDTFMQETPEMLEEVHGYYNIAPQICNEIEKTKDAGVAVYAEVWKKYLMPAVEAVGQNEMQKAHDIYKQMVLDLKQKYL